MKTVVRAFAAAYHAAGDKRIIEDYYPTRWNAAGTRFLVLVVP